MSDNKAFFLWYIKKKDRRRIPTGEMITNAKSDDAIAKWKGKAKALMISNKHEVKMIAVKSKRGAEN